MTPLRRQLPALLVAASLTFVLSGCGPLISWVVAQFPAPRVPAKYNLPKDKKVLVFVDDVLCPVDYEPVKRELTNDINQELMKHKLAKQVVPYDKLLDLIAATPNFNAMPTSTVGQRLGADLVLYVEIDRFSLREDPSTPLWQGTFITRIKVIDCQKPARLWPEDRPKGYPVPPVKTPSTANFSDAYGSQLAAELAVLMGHRICELFYKHKADTPIWSDRS